jgi:hypothetical protein
MLCFFEPNQVKHDRVCLHTIRSQNSNISTPTCFSKSGLYSSNFEIFFNFPDLDDSVKFGVGLE